MNRRMCLFYIILAGVLYQLLRLAAGSDIHPADVIVSAYWSAIALGFHWAASRGWA